MPLFKRRPKCPREGQPVLFDPTRSSYALYHRDRCTPTPGARGRVTAVGKTTCEPNAPGGTTVNVLWGNGCMRPVWKSDLATSGGPLAGAKRRRRRRR